MRKEFPHWGGFYRQADLTKALGESTVRRNELG